jgi:hypothetical protein
LAVTAGKRQQRNDHEQKGEIRFGAEVHGQEQWATGARQRLLRGYQK